MNQGRELHLLTVDELPLDIHIRRTCDACLAIGGVPGCVMWCDNLRLELTAQLGGVYFDTDIKLVRLLHSCCPPGVAAWVACEQRKIISNAAMGFVPNHPAAWRAVNVIEESFFERRLVGDQAGSGLVARITLEHDDVVLWPPACFHPRVGETIRDPDLPRLLMQAHLFAGTWVEGRKNDHEDLWRRNRVQSSN